jgi:hypothetical protein
MKRAFVLVATLLIVALSGCVTPTATPLPTVAPIETVWPTAVSPLPTVVSPLTTTVYVEQRAVYDDTAKEVNVYWIDFLDLVAEFFAGAQLRLILGLVALDVVFGVLTAIQAGEFELTKIGNFYRTNIVPYVGGYLMLYITIGLVPQLEGILGDGLTWGAFGVVTANLAASIFASFQKLGLFQRKM